MNKTLILSVIIGGMCGNIAAPIVTPPVTAAPRPTLQQSPAPTTIETLTLGAEPRRELKFRPTANSKQTMVMTMGMSMDMNMGGNPIPKTSIPKMLMKMDLNVQQVDPSGDIHCNLVYGDIKAIADKDTSPEMLAAMQKSLKSLIGIQDNMVISSSGQVKSKKLILPKTVEPMVRETLKQFSTSMDRFSTPLPTGMLGVGAKWQVNNSPEVGGIKFNQSSTYEIIAINEIGMTVQSKVTQSSPPQDLQIPSVSKGAKVKLTSLTSKGEGTYLIRFDSLLPISGKLSINTDSKMSVQSGPKDQPMNIVNNMVIDLNISDQ